MKSRLLTFLIFSLLFLPACSAYRQDSQEENEVLTIAYADPILDYSPFSYNAKDRQYLANIYEPLLRYDQNFNPDTALALSWGRLDDRTWEFRLRKDVFFHDGTTLDSGDVIYSLNKAIEDDSSGLSALLSGIESVEADGVERVLIKSYDPDPLLLNRLVNVYIVPENYDDFLRPNGTGPYKVKGFEDSSLILSRFDNYWGEIPFFAEARLRYEPSAEERYQSIVNGDVDILANVPPSFVEALKEDVLLLEYPALENSFLIFNTVGPFKDKELREAAWSALDMDYALNLGGGYLKASYQYASSGIFGYINNWEPFSLELVQLEDPVEINLDLPEGLGALGDLLVKDLTKAGFIVNLNEFTANDFEERIYSGDADLFFFGWKYDLADVSDFFESVVDSNGNFNLASYKNEEIDSLIEQASRTLDLEERRMLLEEIARLFYADKVAFPLFEAKLLYGVRPDIVWQARLDGLILASEISKNMLE